MTTFGHCALGTLSAAGVEAVEFWCLTPRCHNRHAVPIVPLIRSVGADAWSWSPGAPAAATAAASAAMCSLPRHPPKAPPAIARGTGQSWSG